MSLTRIKRRILGSLSEGPKTLSQIADGLRLDEAECMSVLSLLTHRNRITSQLRHSYSAAFGARSVRVYALPPDSDSRMIGASANPSDGGASEGVFPCPHCWCDTTRRSYDTSFPYPPRICAQCGKKFSTGPRYQKRLEAWRAAA